MSVENSFVLIVCCLLLVYLMYALLQAERF